MNEKTKKKSTFYFIGLACGIFAILACLTTIALSIVDSFISIYILFLALIFLGINRVGLHLSNFKKNIFESIFLTAFIFLLAFIVAFTKYSIYFLITSMFCYSLTIIAYAIIKMREDRSTQSLVYNTLCIIAAFLYSFVYFFPAIYAKHATSVSNSNFIVLCYCAMIMVSSTKNILSPYHVTLKLNVISKIIKKSLAKEILLSLVIIIILCSVYFTVVEKNITSYVDALWYSFAVITTIGFGDVYVATTLGRILSVILGICGIAAVALFTSFIVNFYNEMNKKREDRIFQKLLQESKDIEKIKEEIKEQDK